MTHTSQNNKSGSRFLCTFHSTNSLSAARKQSVVIFQSWFKRHMNFPLPREKYSVSSNRLPPFELGRSPTALCSEGLASFLDCAQSVKVSRPQCECQKKQHPSNSHTVTLAGGTWPWKPLGSCLRCSLDPVLIQRWCLADVWYREDVVCGPPPTWPKSSTNALTAGGLSLPPQKMQINWCNQSGGSWAPHEHQTLLVTPVVV